MQRKQERAKIGRLQDLIVKPGTLQKYHLSFNKFHDWAVANQFAVESSEDLDAAAAQYLEALWADGFGRSEASYVLAALQFMVPSLRHALPLSWRLMKTWAKHELPTRAVPLDAPTTLAFAGLFWFWGETRLALGILVAFDFFLRTGELFTLQRRHVEFFGTSASLQLEQTKSSALKLHSERLLAWADVSVRSLRLLCRGLLPGEFLVPGAAAMMGRVEREVAAASLSSGVGPLVNTTVIERHCRTSSASSRSQQALPDFNRECQIAVGTAGLHPRAPVSVGSAGLQPRVPDSSEHCRASTASSRFQWALPDFNRELQSPVGTAGLQPRAPDPSGHCRTSTASSRVQWALPDFNRERQIPVGTAGLQL
eukprot:s1161_g14.t1